MVEEEMDLETRNMLNIFLHNMTLIQEHYDTD